jgi:hypothetical protein
MITADTITDEQIRALLETLRLDGEWTREFGVLVWSRQDDMRACHAALAATIVASKWTRETARARCAEILNARAKESK